MPFPDRRRGARAHDPFAASRNRILKTARYMVVYPITYVTLTLPLAAARVSVMAGQNPPAIFFPIAGTMMACCGVVDVILYLSTRKALVKSSVGSRGGDNENLTRFRSRDSMPTRRGDSMLLSGISRGTSRADGRIMVEREVVMIEGPKNSQVTVREEAKETEEEREGLESETGSLSKRSDSLRSLVGRGEGDGRVRR
jgi:hypothetical protein